MFVITVSALKGGVGKTTTCLGLTSAALAHGLRTLVVDFDPQADVTTGLDVSISDSKTVADVFENPTKETIQSAIKRSPWSDLTEEDGHVDVLVGSPMLMNYNGPHPSVRELWKLEEILAKLEGEYDIVLIDCEASLNALTRTAWAASDQVLIVAEPSLFGVSAVDRALKAIQEMRRTLSPRLKPAGVVVNRTRSQSTESQYRVKELKEMFGPLILSPILPERTSLQQAQGAAKPVHAWPSDTAREMGEYYDSILDQIVSEAQNTEPEDS